MHRHPMGKVQSYDDYTVIPLGSGRRLCVLKRGDSVIVADMPGKGKGYYYESGFLKSSGDKPIGVSRSYIIVMDEDEILYGTQYYRVWGIIQSDWTTTVPYYKIRALDKIRITPRKNCSI